MVKSYFAWGAMKEKDKIMVSRQDLSSTKVSRRSILLHGAACAGGIATVLVVNANCAKANPLPKTAVAYQDSPKGDHQCSGCALFVAPDACKNVAGKISPNGWCLLWRKKA
jgi:hypothetical protein